MEYKHIEFFPCSSSVGLSLYTIFLRDVYNLSVSPGSYSRLCTQEEPNKYFLKIISINTSFWAYFDSKQLWTIQYQDKFHLYLELLIGIDNVSAENIISNSLIK